MQGVQTWLNNVQAVTDGKLPDGPAPVAVEIEYTPSDLLLPCSKLEEESQVSLLALLHCVPLTCAAARVTCTARREVELQ